MSLDPTLWPKLHGASTHFPIALAMAAALFESLSLLFPKTSPRKVQLSAAAHYTLLLAALGTLPAALSGLLLTHGEVLGHDALLYHHLFVWPAIVLLIGLALWRTLIDTRITPRARAIHLALLLLTGALISGAGYWGGELLLAEPATVEINSTPQLIAQGRDQYAMSCSHCHADDATGDEGPNLHNLALSNARIAATIQNGRKGEMPSFAKKYDAQQTAALIAYLRTLR